MSEPLRVIIVEDSEDDALLISRELRRGGYEPAVERVDTAAGLNAALDGASWDAVIADYAMPHFNGIAALKLLHARGLDLPFILVSGAVGEETAAQAMKAGVHDYIMKGNLTRLAPAVARELREAGVRRERRQAEEALRQEHERMQRQLHFAQALNHMAETVIAQDDSAGITAALAEILGLTLGADRCLILDINVTAQRADGLCEWLNPARPSTAATLRQYDWPLLQGGIQSLWTARRSLASHTDAPHEGLAPGCANTLHTRMGTQSLLWYPFLFHADGFCLLVLNQVRERRVWQEEELRFLEGVTKQVSIALQKISILKERRRTEEALRESQLRLKKVIEFWDFGAAGASPAGRSESPGT